MFTVLQYLYLLRVPLIFGTILALFGPLAHGAAAALLGGTFDLTWRGSVLVAYIAFWLSAACFFSTELVLRYGRIRMDVAPPASWDRPWRFDMSRAETVCWLLYAAAVAIFDGYLCGSSDVPLAAAGAVAVALIAFLASLWLIHTLSPRERLMGINARIASWLAFSPQGYEHPGGKYLLDYHGRALSVSFASLLIYLAFGVGKGLVLGWLLIGRNRLPVVPTLACLLLLLILLCWSAGALAFFFDRFRIPVLSVFVAVVMAASLWPQSDDSFDVVRQAHTKFSPKQAIEAGGRDFAVVVAASGGGIQASAWSAQVLTGLQQESNGAFAPAVRLVSAVSGGSAGAMQFLGAYRTGEMAAGKLQGIFDRASASSLDDVAWGAIYPDLVRLVTPFLIGQRLGRGWALEQAWARDRWELQEPLSNWEMVAAGGGMPAVMFNATIVETGARAVFSTVDWTDSQTGLVARNFSQLYQGYDVAPKTAARLSATFPYISPAARPSMDLPKTERFHFVDGGYWDNFGVASATEFIDQAVTPSVAGAKPSTVKSILLIEIHDRKTNESETSSGSRGGLFQAAAPLVALYNVRTNGQITRNMEQVRLLGGYLKPFGIQLTHVVFEAPQEDAPMSWHLTRAQIAAITAAWTNVANRAHHDDGFCRTLDFLREHQPAGTPAPALVKPCQ